MLRKLEVIEIYSRNPGEYLELCQRVELRGVMKATWDCSVQKLTEIWNGSDAYCYLNSLQTNFQSDAMSVKE